MPEPYLNEDDPSAMFRGFDPETEEAVWNRLKFHEMDLSGRLGASVTSTTLITIGVGEHVFAADSQTTRFKVGDDVEMIIRDPVVQAMFSEQPDIPLGLAGTVIEKGGTDTDPTLKVLVNDVPAALEGMDIEVWELVVWMRPKAWLEVDVSTTGIDPTDDGPFTLAVTAGKLFNLPAGTVQLRSIAKPHITILTSIKAYSGTSLVLNKIATNSAVSETLSAWDVFLIDAPPPGIPLYQLNGLRVTVNGTDADHDIDISKGSVRDSTDTVDLFLETGVTKRLDAAWAAGTNQGAQVQSANLAGTVSSAALNVTGTGTAFEDDFGAGFIAATLADLVAQGDILASRSSIISAAGVTSSTNTISSDTAMTTLVALGASSATYKRGGYVSNDFAIYGIGIARNDSTGDCEIFATAFSGSGEPDLPSGYTHYRIIARIALVNGVITVSGTGGGMGGGIPYFDQPLVTAKHYGYDNAASERDATNVQEAIDEAFAEIDALPDPSWTVVTPTLSGTVVDVAIPATAEEVIVSWEDVSNSVATRAFRLQALTAAATPDTTAGNYIAFEIVSSGAPAAGYVNLASFVGGAAWPAATAAHGTMHIRGIKSLAGKPVPYTATLDTPASTGQRRAANGHWHNTVQLYGLRFTWDNVATGIYDGGTATVMYR